MTQHIFSMTKPLILLSLLLISACGVASDAKNISPATLHSQLQNEEMLILDVRTPEEFLAGRVPGAINIPHTELSQQIDKLSHYKNTPIVVYCRSGRRASIANGILVDAGFQQLLHLEGDIIAWEAGNFPLGK